MKKTPFHSTIRPSSRCYQLRFLPQSSSPDEPQSLLTSPFYSLRIMIAVLSSLKSAIWPRDLSFSTPLTSSDTSPIQVFLEHTGSSTNPNMMDSYSGEWRTIREDTLCERWIGSSLDLSLSKVSTCSKCTIKRQERDSTNAMTFSPTTISMSWFWRCIPSALRLCEETLYTR